MNTATAQKAKTDELLGWHFVAENGRERWGSRRQIKAGKTYRVRGPIELCVRGLHASEYAIDALKYAPGPIVCRVRLSGRIVRDTDKTVATERTVLSMADATRTLHEFAVWCAQQALLTERRIGREPDRRSWEALRVKRRWLKGKATDGELAAARAAAWDAAGDAAGAAAGDAAWDAAGAAAGDAAWDAAGAAAWAAARDAAGEKQNRKLESMLRKALGV